MSDMNIIDMDHDEDGELNVERFTLPEPSEFEDPYVRKVMERVERDFPGGTFDELTRR